MAIGIFFDRSSQRALLFTINNLFINRNPLQVHDPVAGVGRLPDQHAGLQLPADAGPAGGAARRDGVAGEPHRADGRHPPREGRAPRDRDPHDEQGLEPAVQDHRAGQPRAAGQVRAQAHRLLRARRHRARRQVGAAAPDGCAIPTGKIRLH